MTAVLPVLKVRDLNHERCLNREYIKKRNDLMVKISKDGHSFPHYWSCNTCEDDFEDVTDFVIQHYIFPVLLAHAKRYREDGDWFAKHSAGKDDINGRTAISLWAKVSAVLALAGCKTIEELEEKSK